jgi:hypothetical protein
MSVSTAATAGLPRLCAPLHSGRLEAPGYHPEGCTIKIVHRPYRGGDGDTKNEVVLVNIMGMTAPPEQFCGPARELADAVAAALPPA